MVILTPRGWAYVGTFATLLFGWVIPLALPGPAKFDPAVATAMTMTIAVIFTAAFAAENLIEFRRRSEAEYTPVLHCRVTEIQEGRNASLALHVTNVGRGTAADLEATLWWSDADLVTWLPHHVPGVDTILRPGASTSGSLRHPFIRLTGQSYFRADRPQFVLELQYQDASLRNQVLRHTYEYGRAEGGERQIGRSPLAVPSNLDSLDGKRAALEEEAAAIVEDFKLDTLGLGVEARVSKRTAQLVIRQQGREIWGAQTGIEEPAYRLGEWVRKALPDVLARLSGESDEPSKPAGGDAKG